MTRRTWALIAIASLGISTLAHADILKNWFDDPFFQVRNGIADCPTPLGPYTTETVKKQESHWRVERGTSCWIAGKCRLPNSYYYDKDIAAAVKHTMDTTPAFQADSIWLMFQRRFVWIEGCIADPADAEVLKALVAATPDVEEVIVHLRSNPQDPLPYPQIPADAILQ
ncbi:BON domain-containing protein [Leeia oryzae]|uniref:BON domain-containing protein n=1 Tax=Leeia oryzae TaxID=356662 RepID=UPI0003719243|nr:BON domain-containing protein [Leeia oryzae]